MHTGGPGGGRRGGRGTSGTPSKDLEKMDHKNAINYRNKGPPPRFSHNPKYPPQKDLKMTVHLWIIETFRFCFIVYSYVFQLSTGSCSDPGNDFYRSQILLLAFKIFNPVLVHPWLQGHLRDLGSLVPRCGSGICRVLTIQRSLGWSGLF